MRPALAAVLVTLLLPAAAAAESPQPATQSAATPRPATPTRATPIPPSPFGIEARVTALGGASSGLGTRTDSGGVGILRFAAVPSVHRGTFELKVPLRLDRDQALGTDLTETIAAAAVDPQWRAAEALTLGAEAGVHRVWRLNWPDQYQPDVTNGGLLPTDRYSYTALRAGANAWLRPARHQHLRARWRVTSYEYDRDPAFTLASPTHLTPRDNVEHQLDASWRYVDRGWAVSFRLDTAFRRDSVYPARHALTGLTRTPTQTPHQALNGYEPAAEAQLRNVARQLDLSFGLGWVVQDDTYEGYYSYSGPHPHVRADWAVTRLLSVAADAQAWWLRYGPNAQVNTENGQRRYDHRLALKTEVRYALGRGLSFLGEGTWRNRATNYRDYVPGVNPPTRQYDVDWDYDNFRLVGGLEWRG
jgi:hypothetical protein